MRVRISRDGLRRSRILATRPRAARLRARSAAPHLASSARGSRPARWERDRLPAFRALVPRRRPAPRRAVDESYDMGSYDPEMDGFVPPEISLRSLKIGDKIGEGAFSEVYRGVVEGADGTSGGVVAKAYKKRARQRLVQLLRGRARDVPPSERDGVRGGRAVPWGLRFGRVFSLARRRRQNARVVRGARAERRGGV